MNIVMLSGGSGKRLWPLSNDIRSKQFIRLLKDPVGYSESMVQRVFRQIQTAICDAHVTIATSKTQVSAIRNHLGNNVSICIEPARCDTFPAIALASMYLHDVLHVDENECVIVCPVDPYVQTSYFECFSKLEASVGDGISNITLMGITPTYPSDKYGYIIPLQDGELAAVQAFKEKPSCDIAAEYIQQGALWNAGVFAFKLGYMINKAHELIDFIDYADLLEKYPTLEKISFDYAVVEHEPSIQVVRYAGEWRDVGTWNTITEVMAAPVEGNAVIDDTCTNTHIINELGIPILCMGCNNMVVAASGDGILVADKECSGQIKAYADKIKGEVRFADKSWGTYTVLYAQPGVMTIKVSLNAGKRMKYHSHELRKEVWSVISGNGYVILDGKKQTVMPGSVIDIPIGSKHTVIAQTDMDIIETQMGIEISPSDKQVFLCDF